MRATLCLLSLAVAASAAAPAHAGDRYGPANPYQLSRLAPDYAGPLLGWNNKAAAPPALPLAAAAQVQAARPVQPSIAPAPVRPAPVRPAALPTSLYDAPSPQVATPPYAVSRPTGQPIELSTAALAPTLSLERQQAADEDTAMLAARIARADALAAQGGKPQTSTELLGGR